MKHDEKIDMIDLALMVGAAFCWAGVWALSVLYGALVLGVLR